jgi:non-heme chloroperoxidase
VVFVPGMTDVAADYDSLAGVIDRRTIVIDLRGHGLSDAPADGYGMAEHVGDIDAVVNAAVGPDRPVHLMTFSRGTGYAFGWIDEHRERVLSLSIGDYPAREIAIPVTVADTLLQSTWRGTPVSERLDRGAAVGKFAASRDHPRWDLVAAIAAGGVPVLVVRSTAAAPMTDDDWVRYHQLDVPIELVEFDDSPHDIFRPDRTRYPRLVAELIERADARLPR